MSEVLDSSDNTVDQTESCIMDLVGNRIRRTIDKPNTTNDVTDIYAYDSNDRLQSENRYAGLFPTGTPTGSAPQNTAYTWSGTQQTSKTVSVPSVSSVVQNLSYGLGGQLERVVTTNSNGSGVVSARSQVEYGYDNTGVRFIAIESTDSSPSTPAFDRVENGRTEYLIDHASLTGYQQTIIETVKNAAGQSTRRTSYTFGTDEITQTVSNLDPATGNVNATETLTFGHDGHGSTRVLFGAAAAIAQIYTYSAYGELLAVHNALGQAQALTSTMTSMLYNGEAIDSRTGLYNFRARWYSASNGRFERLDPFAGNPSDPFSFNKYGAFHGNPVMMTDPTGLFGYGASLGGMSIGTGIQGMSAGAALALSVGISAGIGAFGIAAYANRHNLMQLIRQGGSLAGSLTAGGVIGSTELIAAASTITVAEAWATGLLSDIVAVTAAELADEVSQNLNFYELKNPNLYD